jgi:hypothetical protein
LFDARWPVQANPWPRHFEWAPQYAVATARHTGENCPKMNKKRGGRER